ncbi:barrier to autointegration factor [Oesophagostomum dentatum]|uniref:Barrier to autointegration factor n=1 Tax=Oesophagostomum dentatum TaxID=61180 RepID=A0A0B1SKA7_OESDE|nr:barrier to autointegration factor [Oesophagostomum dentatum]
MSTTVKHKEFTSEPIGNKNSTAIAGIGPKYGAALAENGYGQCLFKYYQVPEKCQCEVWRDAGDAMNTRVRRLRRKNKDNAEAAPRVCVLSRRESPAASSCRETPLYESDDPFDEYYFKDY